MFIQCSLEVSFQGQRKTQKYKSPNKFISLSMRFFVNYMLLVS